MLTAKEARTLREQINTTDEKLEALIRYSCTRGLTRVRVPHNMTGYKPYKAFFKTKGTEDRLKAAGYTVTYEEKSQGPSFMDFWIEISWAE